MTALRSALALLMLASAPVLAQTPAASVTSGLRFRTIGPAAMSGRFVDLAVYESQPHVFYAASSTGGLYKTTNNGVSFTALFNNEATHSIGAIALDQRDTSLVWLGTGERANRQSSSWGDGVYKSTRRRHDVAQRRLESLRTHRPHCAASHRPQSRVRRRRGPTLGAERRARALSHK